VPDFTQDVRDFIQIHHRYFTDIKKYAAGANLLFSIKTKNDYLREKEVTMRIPGEPQKVPSQQTAKIAVTQPSKEANKTAAFTRKNLALAASQGRAPAREGSELSGRASPGPQSQDVLPENVDPKQIQRQNYEVQARQNQLRQHQFKLMREKK
jgi:hypothetical protein